jgi:hypothetical protein
MLLWQAEASAPAGGSAVLPVALLVAGVPAASFTMQSEMTRLPVEPLRTNPAVRQASRNGKHGLRSVEVKPSVFEVTLFADEAEFVAAESAGLAWLHAASERLRHTNRTSRSLNIVFPLHLMFLVFVLETRENT